MSKKYFLVYLLCGRMMKQAAILYREKRKIENVQAIS